MIQLAQLKQDKLMKFNLLFNDMDIKLVIEEAVKNLTII